MSLKTILAAKGDNIICIESTADLAAAAKLLSTHRIGALVVLGASLACCRSAISCAQWRMSEVPFCSCRLRR
jgi:hypothetical protein